MRSFLALILLCSPIFLQAQFVPGEEGLTIIVTDGTYSAKDSPQSPPGDHNFTAPIRPLGMSTAIQAGAFTDRPVFGKEGFLLIFCVNDSIGGKQGVLTINGQEVRGVYRLIRQRMSADEEPPEGMTTYRLSGTVYLLGVS